MSAHHLHGEPIPAIEAVQRPFTPFEVGDAWGGAWDTTWFRFRGSIPDSWAGAEVVALIHLGGDQMVGFTAEGQIWDTGLRPVQGLHHRHREFVLTPEAQGDEPVEFFVEAAANPIPPWHLADWPLLLPDYSGAPLYTLETAELAVVDRSVEGLFLDMRILVELAALDPDRSEEIMRGAGQGTGASSTPRTSPPGWSRPGTCWLRSSTGPRPRPTASWRWVTPTSTAPGCGRYARPGANAQGPSPTSCDCSSATPSTTSCAARPCSTSG